MQMNYYIADLHIGHENISKRKGKSNATYTDRGYMYQFGQKSGQKAAEKTEFLYFGDYYKQK